MCAAAVTATLCSHCVHCMMLMGGGGGLSVAIFVVVFSVCGQRWRLFRLRRCVIVMRDEVRDGDRGTQRSDGICCDPLIPLLSK